MSESAEHQKLVTVVLKQAQIMVGSDKCCFIMSDLSDGHEISPLTAEGFRPDVFYQYSDVMIIGEAKTADDVERLHSKQQYESYIKKCASFSGKAYLLIAAPWSSCASLNNILSRIKKKYPGNYSIKVLEGF